MSIYMIKVYEDSGHPCYKVPTKYECFVLIGFEAKATAKDISYPSRPTHQ